MKRRRLRHKIAASIEAVHFPRKSYISFRSVHGFREETSDAGHRMKAANSAPAILPHGTSEDNFVSNRERSSSIPIPVNTLKLEPDYERNKTTPVIIVPLFVWKLFICTFTHRVDRTDDTEHALENGRETSRTSLSTNRWSRRKVKRVPLLEIVRTAVQPLNNILIINIL